VIILLINLLLFLHFIQIFFSLKIVIFGGLIGPPKIRCPIFGRPLFSAARDLAAEIKLFSVTTWQPPKISLYFRRVFWRPPKIAYFRRLVPSHRK
jgi:hypothetical protein